MVDFLTMKCEMENLGYYGSDELLYETFNALCMFDKDDLQKGQDIYALCLEGPPGAGKTKFVDSYVLLCNKLLKDKVSLVSYQCDATTGKSELFEDINISAAISRDGSKVNIPGKLVDAIKKVNNGEKVVLFMD